MLEVALIRILPFDKNAAEQAAAVRQQLEAAGRSIGMCDSMIAGIASANEVPVLTRNRKHFERVGSLRLLDPVEQKP